MTTTEIVSALDHEIARLLQVRTILFEIEPIELAAKPQAAAKKTIAKKAVKAAIAKPVAKKSVRTMSAEGRARIAAAQKKRWAAQRKVLAFAKRVPKPAAQSPAPLKVLSKPAKKSFANTKTKPPATAKKVAPTAPTPLES